MLAPVRRGIVLGMVGEARERRAKQRFKMQLPIIVLSDVGEVIGTTKDVSAGGVFFYTDSEVRRSSPIDFTLLLPSELTQSKEIVISCRGTVIRVEPGEQDTIGIAVTIEWYAFGRT